MPKKRKSTKTRKTKNQIAWEKEYRNLKNRIRSAQKRGYTFPELEIARPSRITKKAISELHELRGVRLLSRGLYNREGEIVSGYKGYEYEQRRAAERRKSSINESELIIDNLVAQLNNQWFGAGPVKYRLIEFINRIVMSKGANNVARVLKEDADRNMWEVNREVAYNFDGAQDQWINHMLRALDAPRDLISDLSVDADDGIPLGDTEEVWLEKTRPSR